MPNLRDLLNEIKWTKDLEKLEIWYIHRGAPHNTKVITGAEILSLRRSFLETTSATIPYHRITKVLYEGKTLFDRLKRTKEQKVNKQL
ncbi:MAG TPA: DUF504 domain-containing protein [Candidatus Thermoplasmatota archaeon]|nr:DUF504 domain-containing protein [Candidatus Thermoplasmatota archaeon]